MTTIVGIDFDTPVYAIGFKTEEEPVENALHSAKVFIDKVVTACNADQYVLFLTGKDNFRDKIATIQPYKGNREKNRKPQHYQAIRDYAIKYHGAIVVDGAEADDALGIFLTEPEDGVTKICASIDKDLNMIPGYHYNWNHGGLYYIDDKRALQTFYDQIITGDSTDNIPGLYRVTGQKATKNMKGCASYSSVLWQYKQSYREKIRGGQVLSPTEEHGIEAAVAEIANLLWIRRYDCEGFGDYLERLHSNTTSTANLLRIST